MSSTRTSSRQAARKANEAISGADGTRGKAAGGVKRKEPTGKAPIPKRERKDEPEQQEEQNGEDGVATEQHDKEQLPQKSEESKAGEPEREHQAKEETADGKLS